MTAGAGQKIRNRGMAPKGDDMNEAGREMTRQELLAHMNAAKSAAYTSWQIALELYEKLKKVEVREEQGQVQLAGCLTAAEGHTDNPARVGDYGWSVAYQKVLDLRRDYDKAKDEARSKLRSIDLVAEPHPEPPAEVAPIPQWPDWLTPGEALGKHGEWWIWTGESKISGLSLVDFDDSGALGGKVPVADYPWSKWTENPSARSVYLSAYAEAHRRGLPGFEKEPV